MTAFGIGMDRSATGNTRVTFSASRGAGWRYAARRKDLLGTYLVDIVCMLLAFPIVLFPALAADIFEHPQLL